MNKERDKLTLLAREKAIIVIVARARATALLHRAEILERAPNQKILLIDINGEVGASKSRSFPLSDVEKGARGCVPHRVTPSQGVKPKCKI